MTLAPKEWDSDSAARKFRNSWCVMGDYKKQIPELTVWVEQPAGQTDHYWQFYYRLPDVSDPQISNGFVPLYQRFPAGFYDTYWAGQYLLLLRAPGKQFSIGCNSGSHNAFTFNQHGLMDPHDISYSSKPILHKPLDINLERAIEVGGPISNKLFLTKGGIFFLNKKVGVRSKSKLLVSDFISQEVYDTLKGTKCQIVEM